MFLDVNLADYYKTSFRLQKDFGFSIEHIENMVPFEYKVYLNTVLEWIKEEQQRIKQNSR
jgi:hypothetical protein